MENRALVIPHVMTAPAIQTATESHESRNPNMPLLPIKPIKLPSYLVGVENGKLPKSLLYPTQDGGYLCAHACWWYTALQQEARKHGYELTFTYGGMYRSYDNQVILFLQRYDKVSLATYLITASSKRRKWQGNYYKLKPGVAAAAVPGTSNHGLGLAIDLALGTSPKTAKPLTNQAINWLIQYAPWFGFSAESQSEPWHWRYIAGGD